jgi:UPF0271 protein
MDLTPDEVEAFVLYQLGALAGFARAGGTRLAHVKPHGALYNWAAEDRRSADAIARAVASFDPALTVVALPGSALVEAAHEHNLRAAREGFADRAYQADGQLVPRREPGAVIRDPAEAAARGVKMVTQGVVEAVDGTVVPLKTDTLCVHGDTPDAVRIASALREALQAAGVAIGALSGRAS